VRPEGLPYDLAAFKLHYLITHALRLKLTGVGLKDDSDCDSDASLSGPASPGVIDGR
jgi:ethanolamine ammonia-lyase small subunit